MKSLKDEFYIAPVSMPACPGIEGRVRKALRPAHHLYEGEFALHVNDSGAGEMIRAVRGSLQNLGSYQ